MKITLYIACTKPCACRWCVYNIFGLCTDNVPCAEQKEQ